VDIFLKIVASLTGLLGGFILLAAMLKRFEHKGMTLAGISYLLGGLLSLVYPNWWPLIIGILTAVVIRKKYGEPNYERTPEYGVALTKKEAKDAEKVGMFLIAFLKTDPIGKNLFDKKFQDWSETGFLKKFALETENKEPLTNNIVPWFMNYMRPKIGDLSKINSDEFNQLVKNLNEKSANHLETLFEITEKYNLSIEQVRFHVNFPSGSLPRDDQKLMYYSIFADNIIHTELRVLQYLYTWWNPN
jgi:hypothetical protein